MLALSPNKNFRLQKKSGKSTYKNSIFFQSTPAHARWDETPGHPKGSETPGATPGQSTRMWDATPGHATPGAATPGRETPGHEKGASSRRNRWDETPKTERGYYNNSCLKLLFDFKLATKEIIFSTYHFYSDL